MKEQLDKLLKLLADDTKNAGKPGKCFHDDQEWDEATGGWWVAGVPVYQGQMIKLARQNYDHFQPQAKKPTLLDMNTQLRKLVKQVQ